MIDTVSKVLAIKITADDLTGGAWSKLKEGIDSAKEWMTPLNQAWELSAKLWGKISEAASGAVGILTAGGELNETTAAFRNLTESTGQDGEAMVRHLQDVTDGVMGMQEAMQMASRAINAGFDARSANAIASFAKKIEEATGESMTSTMEQIERAIKTGQRLERLEMFGIHITKGMEATEVVKQFDAATQKFGAGAFNFGDLWKGAWKSIGDAIDAVAMEMNIIMGKDGAVEDGFRRFRAGTQGIKDEAPGLAAAIFTPVRQFTQWLDILTGGVENLGAITVGVVSFVGNSMYDLLGVFAKVAEGYANIVGNLAAADKIVSDFMGNTKNSKRDEEIMRNMEALAGWGDDLNKSQVQFNEALMQTGEIRRQQAREGLTSRPVEMVNVGNRASGAVPRGKNVLWQSGDTLDTSGGSTKSSNQPGQLLKGDTSGARVIQLAAPPSDALMNVLVDWINKAIVKEGAQGAGA